MLVYTCTYYAGMHTEVSPGCGKLSSVFVNLFLKQEMAWELIKPYPGATNCIKKCNLTKGAEFSQRRPNFLATLPDAPVTSQESSSNFRVNIIGNKGNREINIQQQGKNYPAIRGTLFPPQITKNTFSVGHRTIHRVSIGVFPFMKALVKKIQEFCNFFLHWGFPI